MVYGNDNEIRVRMAKEARTARMLAMRLKRQLKQPNVDNINIHKQAVYKHARMFRRMKMASKRQRRLQTPTDAPRARAKQLQIQGLMSNSQTDKLTVIVQFFQNRFVKLNLAN